MLSETERETIVVRERGRGRARARERERGCESWRREVNEKFIRLQVPKALLSLPGVLSFKLLGRGGGTVPEEMGGTHKHTCMRSKWKITARGGCYLGIRNRLKREATAQQHRLTSTGCAGRHLNRILFQWQPLPLAPPVTPVSEERDAMCSPPKTVSVC